MLDWLQNFRRERYIAKLKANGLSLGRGVYLNDGFFLDPDHCHLITIEDNVVFGPCVRVFAHDASSLKVIGKTKIAPVVLKQNCFIGANSTILPGSVVGENSIVAAGSVVTTEIPAGELWGGVPARRLMSIDDYRGRLNALPQHDYPENEYAMNVLTPKRRAEMQQRLGAEKIGFMKRIK